MREVQLMPFSVLSTSSSSSVHDACVLEMPSTKIEWPPGRVPGGFLSKASKKMLPLNDTSKSKMLPLNDTASPPSPSHSVLHQKMTLDSIVSEYLKHQHCCCPAPKSILPPLSLVQPHVCREPRRSFVAPSNMTARLFSRQCRSMYSGFYEKDRQYVYSRFKPMHVYEEANIPIMTCMTLLGTSSHIVAGTESGSLKFISPDGNDVNELNSHDDPILHVRSYAASNGVNLVLSSTSREVQLLQLSSTSPEVQLLQTGSLPIRAFEGCKAANFSNAGTCFAALPFEVSQREILLYDTMTFQLRERLEDRVLTLRGRIPESLVHFDQSDNLCLWNGVLWDRRVAGAIHHFDLISDYGGGGFHPMRNQVIINSEIWDMRLYRLLQTVPTLDETCLTFNQRGNVIYAWSRRNLFEILNADPGEQLPWHRLASVFQTLDGLTYTDIATIQVGGRILSLAQEPTDSFIGLLSVEEALSSMKLYSIGFKDSF